MTAMLGSMRIVLMLACSLLAGCALPVREADRATTFIVVRHAEKVDASRDPDLSAAGLTRAQALSARLDGPRLDAIYATEFKRTGQTVAPSAASHRVAITPLPSMYRVGSTMEFAGFDSTLNPQRLQLLRDGASLYLREPLTKPVLEEWYGWRPMTPDSLPFIGRLPAIDNVYLAAGHGMLGVSMSPATGKLVAETMTGQSPHIDPHPYRVAR